MEKLKEINKKNWKEIKVNNSWDEISIFIKNSGKLFTESKLDNIRSNGWEFYSIRFQPEMLEKFKKLVDNEEKMQVLAEDKQANICTYEMTKIKNLNTNEQYYERSKDNFLVKYGFICEKVINKSSHETIFNLWNSENTQEWYKSCCLANLFRYNSKILNSKKQFISEEAFCFLQEIAGETEISYLDISSWKEFFQQKKIVNSEQQNLFKKICSNPSQALVVWENGWYFTPSDNYLDINNETFTYCHYGLKEREINPLLKKYYEVNNIICEKLANKIDQLEGKVQMLEFQNQVLRRTTNSFENEMTERLPR